MAATACGLVSQRQLQAKPRTDPDPIDEAFYRWKLRRGFSEEDFLEKTVLSRASSPRERGADGRPMSARQFVRHLQRMHSR
jgi:hypothetical protein